MGSANEQQQQQQQQVGAKTFQSTLENQKLDDNIDAYIHTLISRCGSFSSETIASRHSQQRISRFGTNRLSGTSALARVLRNAENETTTTTINSTSSNDHSHSNTTRNHYQCDTIVNGDSNGKGTTAVDDKSPQARATATTTKKKRLNSCFHGYRFLVVIFGGMSVGLMCFLRYNITISVLKMVNQTHLYMEEHPGATLDDMIADGHAPGGEFNWNNEIQQMIMSWYMMAYTLPQLPMARLGSMMGCRLAVPLALGLCIIATMLTPCFAYLGWEYVIFLRLVNGFGASPVLPMLIALLESWLPEDEISLGLGISQSLSVILIASNPLISGHLSSIHWTLSFYVPGIFGIVFCFLWLLLISDQPDDNPLVSQKELEFIYGGFESKNSMIESNRKNSQKNNIIGEDNDNQNNEDEDNDDDYKPDSWIAMLRVPSFYAYLALWSLHCSSFNAFNFVLPTYLIQFLRIKVAQNGLYCSIIQSGCVLAVIWPHPFLKLLQNKFNLTDRVSRRVVLAMCCCTVAATWIFVGLFHEFQLILLFLNRCTQNGVDVIITSTLMLNYARSGLSALAFSAMNTVGNLSVVFSCTFVGWYLDHTAQSRFGWCSIFVTLGLVQVILWLFYALIIPVRSIKFKHKRKNESVKMATDDTVATDAASPA